MPNTMFHPREYEAKITPKDVDAVVYLQRTQAGRPAAMGFAGKATRPSFNYQFKDDDGRAQYVDEYIKGLIARDALKLQRRAEQKAFDARNFLDVGDVIVNSWGYDQTNVDFYVIQSVSAKFVTVQPCSSELTGGAGHSMSGYRIAKPETMHGEITRHGVYAFGSDARINFKYGSAQKWDGQPEFCSWYA